MTKRKSRWDSDSEEEEEEQAGVKIVVDSGAASTAASGSGSEATTARSHSEAGVIGGEPSEQRDSRRQKTTHDPPPTNTNPTENAVQSTPAEGAGDHALASGANPGEGGGSGAGKAEVVILSDSAAVVREAPDFRPSGALAAEQNTVNGVVVKFATPPDAVMPKRKWRLYVFKGGETVEQPVPMSGQQWYLIGRDRAVADLPVDHPSCSKQHAVICHRRITVQDPDSGRKNMKEMPYIMDLESTHGTQLNGLKLSPARFYELRDKDVIRLGMSTREYVFLAEDAED